MCKEGIGVSAVIVAAALAVLTTSSACNSGRPSTTALEVEDRERLLVLSPHPDDETLGAGGLIQRVIERGGTVRVVLATAGDGYVEAVRHETGELNPRPAEYVAYGEWRMREARAAMRELAPRRLRLELLGFPDGGLERLLLAHYWRSDPGRSPTTHASHPPYPDALDPNLPYDGDDLRAELVRILRETRPTIVALPDYLDRHPDHRATGIFTLMAVGDWTKKGAEMPRLLAYLIHWPGWPPGWDLMNPSPAARQGSLELPSDLPDRGLASVSLSLSEAEVTAKAAALSRYATQQAVMPGLMAAFVRQTEPFTIFTGAQIRAVGELIERTPAAATSPSVKPWAMRSSSGG